jgi:antitoxin MazE
LNANLSDRIIIVDTSRGDSLMTTSTIQMWGNTRAVRIPKALAEELSLQPGTAVELSKVGTQLVVKLLRKQKKYKLSELLAQCKGKNPSGELITGRAGKEIF